MWIVESLLLQNVLDLYYFQICKEMINWLKYGPKYQHSVLNRPFPNMSKVRQISHTLTIQLVLSANQQPSAIQKGSFGQSADRAS